jgi:hypothetical protein
MSATAAAPGGPAVDRWTARRRRLDELAASFVGLTADGVTVLTTHAAFHERPDVGDTIIEITLGLSDPPPGRVTWPISALWAFEREVRRRSYRADFDEFVYVDSRNANPPAEDPAADRDGDIRRGRIRLSHERPEFR